MTHIIGNNYTKDAAKAIISAFYNADKSSAYIGSRHYRLNGNCVNVHIAPTATGWALDVYSSVWMPATVNEIINKALA